MAQMMYLVLFQSMQTTILVVIGFIINYNRVNTNIFYFLFFSGNVLTYLAHLKVLDLDGDHP